MVDSDSNLEGVADTFDEFIRTNELLHAAERSLAEYLGHNVPPEMPEHFEGFDALLRYNAEKARYDLGHRRVLERMEDRTTDYARAASRVEALLPEGARLVHAHGRSSGEIPYGKRYLVYKEG